MLLADLVRDYTPGDEWSWDEEERDILSHVCVCCGQPGHYQLALEDHLRAAGQIDQGVCLGSDGRIWDGHHRIVAARRLGFAHIPIETP